MSTPNLNCWNIQFKTFYGFLFYSFMKIILAVSCNWHWKDNGFEKNNRYLFSLGQTIGLQRIVTESEKMCLCPISFDLSQGAEKV